MDFDDDDHSNLPVIRLTRRRALGLLGGLGAVVIAGCSSGSESTSATSTSTASGSSTTAAGASTTAAAAATSTTAATASTTAAAAATTAAPALTWLTPPSETIGPFAADGSNQNGAGATANVLDKASVFRTDMTGDLDGSNVQPGIPLTLKVKVGKKADRSAFVGAAVYVWHCNRDGQYSAYSGDRSGGDLAARSFNRAVGVADANGDVTFTSILPGRYQGRATHIHFAVYRDRTFADRLVVSQFAFDDDETDALYATDSAYASSLRNPTYNARDGVFRDGVDNQLLDLRRASAVEAAINILV